MAKLTEKQWTRARAFYEIGNSGNATAKKFKTSRRTIQLRVVGEGWTQSLEKKIAAKVAEKVAGRKPGYSLVDTEKAIDTEASKRAKIELRHRDEPGHIRTLLYSAIKDIKASVTSAEKKLAMDDLKSSKLAMEIMKGMQEMERKSYRLDIPSIGTEPPPPLNIAYNVNSAVKNVKITVGKIEQINSDR